MTQYKQMKTGFDFFVQQELAPLLWSGDMWCFIYLCTAEKENKPFPVTTLQQSVLPKYQLENMTSYHCFNDYYTLSYLGALPFLRTRFLALTSVSSSAALM